MRAALLAVMASAMATPALPLAAFAQGRGGIVLQAQPPASPMLPTPAAPRTGPAPGDFQPAPLPDRDYDAPPPPRASAAPQLAPGIFTRKDQYRGDGYTAGSTSESEVQRKVRPGAGFSLRLPLQPQ